MNMYDFVVVDRNILHGKNVKIIELEQTLAAKLNESNQLNEQEEAFHSEHLKEVHLQYCEALDKLKQINMEMDEKHLNEIERMQYAMEDVKNVHKNEMQKLEDELKQEIGVEYSRKIQICDEMNAMKKSYEAKLDDAKNDMQKTIQCLEIDSKQQLEERHGLLRDIMAELDMTKRQFADYCASVSDDHARKTLDLKMQYEQKLHSMTNELTDTKLYVEELRARVSNLTANCDEIEQEKALIQNAWHNGQRRQKELSNEANELRNEILDRDRVIHDREMRFKHCEQRNQELNKYKTVLNFKIDELSQAVEPRNQEIGKKSAEIVLLKDEIENLAKHGIKSDLKLDKANGEVESITSELNAERERRRSLQALNNRICRDIYLLSRNIADTKNLPIHVTKFYQKYEYIKSLICKQFLFFF